MRGVLLNFGEESGFGVFDAEGVKGACELFSVGGVLVVLFGRAIRKTHKVDEFVLIGSLISCIVSVRLHFVDAGDEFLNDRDGLGELVFLNFVAEQFCYH